MGTCKPRRNKNWAPEINEDEHIFHEKPQKIINCTSDTERGQYTCNI